MSQYGNRKALNVQGVLLVPHSEYVREINALLESVEVYRNQASENGRVVFRLRQVLKAQPDSDLASLAEYYVKFYETHQEEAEA